MITGSGGRAVTRNAIKLLKVMGFDPGIVSNSMDAVPDLKPQGIGTGSRRPERLENTPPVYRFAQCMERTDGYDKTGFLECEWFASRDSEVFDFLDSRSPDIICLQETKLSEVSLTWNWRDIPSTSTMLKRKDTQELPFSQDSALKVTYGMGIEAHDREEE